MNKITKIIALVLVAVMMMAMSSVAFAADGEKVTITVNRDSTYAGTPDEAGRAFTWYKIFSATYKTSVSTNASGYEDDGTATFDNTATEGIAYTATSAVAAKLGSWVATTYYVEGDTIPEGKKVGDVKEAGHWDKGSTGNEWFDLTPISGSTNYSVSWRKGVTADVDAMQAAAAWLIEKGAYEATGDMSFADAKWTASVDKGYYVIKSDVGDNLVAATTDININEKNDYPPLDKTQKDEDATEQGDEEVDVAVGDTIEYEVKVTIPKTAAVGNTIEVWDIPTDGLDYQDDIAVKTGSNTGNAAIADGALGTDEIWHKVITVTDGSQGTDVIFTFSCIITEDALVDTGRENTSKLKYGNHYESKPDKVTYTTYFSGIHKVDAEGSAANGLQGVKFVLKENGQAFNVTKKGDYYIPGGTSNEVVTDKDGYIKIRGLDDDKTYTLTETETLPGYNMLEEDVTLKLVEDKDDAFINYDADSYQDVVNKQGTVLPSTGGIGTTIFYVLGAILVLGAGIMLVTKRRMGVEK